MATDSAVTAAANLEASQRERRAGLQRLKLDGQGPIWMQIRRAISQPILSGEWRPGDRIPAELELTEHFRTARMTVSRAIQSLASQGLVQRRRKVGTVVAERAQERPIFEIWDTASLVARTGAAYGYRLLERSFLGDDEEQRIRLGVGPHTHILHIRCMHLADDRPFQLEDRLINVDAAPGITSQPLDGAAPSPWLLAHVPWTQAEHAISACEADRQTAALLQVRAGSACLVVERRTWNGEVPVTMARLWQAGPQHRLTGRFEPSR